jgi:hypothetical protein
MGLTGFESRLADFNSNQHMRQAYLNIINLWWEARRKKQEVL